MIYSCWSSWLLSRLAIYGLFMLGTVDCSGVAHAWTPEYMAATQLGMKLIQGLAFWPSGIIPMLAHGNHTWSTLAVTAVLGWWLRWNQNKFMDCSLLGPHVLSSSVWTYGGCELPWLAFVSFCKPLLPLLHPTSQCGFCWLTTCGPYINSFFAWVLQWQNSEWNSGCGKRNNIIQQACLCCLCFHVPEMGVTGRQVKLVELSAALGWCIQAVLFFFLFLAGVGSSHWSSISLGSTTQLHPSVMHFQHGSFLGTSGWVPAGPTQWCSRALKKVTVWLALKDK